MRDVLRIDPKHMELHNELYERRHIVSMGSVWTSRKLVGRSCGVLLLSPKCARITSGWPDAWRTSVQFTIGRADHCMWSTINFHLFFAKHQGRLHQFGTKVFPVIFSGYALIPEGGWTGDLLIVDTEDLKTMPPSEIHVKEFKQKRWTFEQETPREILHDGQPSSTL